MKFTIIVESEETREVYPLAEAVHNILTGNKDYKYSNIILNFNNSKEQEEASLYIDIDKCEDKVMARQLMNSAVDTILNKIL